MKDITEIEILSHLNNVNLKMHSSIDEIKSKGIINSYYLHILERNIESINKCTNIIEGENLELTLDEYNFIIFNLMNYKELILKAKHNNFKHIKIASEENEYKFINEIDKIYKKKISYINEIIFKVKQNFK